MAFLNVSHRQCFNSMDCPSNVLGTLLPDSIKAHDVTCARTKVDAILISLLSSYWVDVAIRSSE